jgi:hypothetical protein
LGNIEQDIFYCQYERVFELDKIKKQDKDNWLYIKDSIIGRLEIYLYDYFEKNKLFE